MEGYNDVLFIGLMSGYIQWLFSFFYGLEKDQ